MIIQSTGISPWGGATAGAESCALAVEIRANEQAMHRGMCRSSFMGALIGRTVLSVGQETGPQRGSSVAGMLNPIAWETKGKTNACVRYSLRTRSTVSSLLVPAERPRKP